MTIVGLDLSLTKTGFAVIKDGGKVLSSGVIKSKPLGDRPIDEAIRISTIAREIVEKLDEVLPDENPDLVVIEGMAFMARNTTALVQLAALNYFIRIILIELGWPFLIIAPTSLKKFITGSGRGEKSLMMMTVYKQYGFEALDDNECDSYGLSVCGLAVKGMPINPLNKPQLEVINLLKKQL